MSRIILVTFTVAVAMVTITTAKPLDDYVNIPDSHYKYNLLSTIKGVGYTLHVLNMTSQKWLDESVVRNPIWWHYLTIGIPDKIDYPDTSYIWINWKSNTDKAPSLTDTFSDLMAVVAVTTGSVCATIEQIPNQPTVFVDDPSHKKRMEDEIIAWTWKIFLHNSTDPRILLRMPMTKAVVRGMDTVVSYSKKITDHEINKFVVGGGSKRGWTAWTVAAVDKRVIGFTPVVMDLLNFHKSLHHYYQSVGGWTFAFKPYYELGITKSLDAPSFRKMQQIIDPLGRDFQLFIKDTKTGQSLLHPVLWFPGKTKKISNTEYEAKIEKPLKGWAAFFIQVTFEGAKNFTLEFTTEMCMVPDVFPFPDCTGKGCQGELV